MKFNITKKTILAALAITILFSSQGITKERDRYLGVGIISNTYESDDGIWSGIFDEESGSGFSIHGGRLHSDYIVSEFAYHNLGTYKSAGLEVSASNISFALKAKLPLDFIEPYILFGLGIGIMSAEAPTLAYEDTGTGLSTRFGLGARLPLGRHFAANIFYEKISYTIEVENQGIWWGPSYTTEHDQEFTYTGASLEYLF